MARIPDHELDRLKREISVERLATSRGVRLERHGQDLVGLCPFHDDHEPSLVISPSKNLWHCLGACQSGGSPIDWVMKVEGVSFRDAVEILQRRSPAPAEKTSSSLDLDPSASAPPLLSQVTSYYHQTLKSSAEAIGYLEKRGLGSKELIDRFQLGFANRTLGQLLPKKAWKAGAAIRSRLQELGILRSSGHEHFNGSIVIPICDRRGDVVEIYGRKITPNLRKGTPLHLYLPGRHRGVWNLEALAESKEIILCEALIDAMTFWSAGFRNVTSSYGIQGFTDEHLEAFQAYGTKRVLIAYDRDEAGEKAAKKLAERLAAIGIECYRILFPRGMDANEYAVKVQPAAKSLELVIRKASWMGIGKPPSVPMPAPPVALEEKKAAKEEKKRLSSLAAPASAEPPSPATVPAAPKLEIPAEIRDQEVVISLGDRRYRVRGLDKNLSYDVLKINLLAGRDDHFHVDTLDLYSARQRAAYVKQAATELGLETEVVKKDVGKVLLKLEELQDEQIRTALSPAETVVALSPEEREEALELLRDPKLLDRVLEDFEACGVVGEETNKLTGYLAAVSRKLERPLAVILQSSSAAGKSALMGAILAMVPEEERVQYSAMTGQSLFYMGETNLQHKILAIAEEEGAERASYALKLLQSEGELTIASTGKDPASGKLVTHEYRVEGPVMIFLTTTAIDIDEELLNRCLVLTVDEEREQTRAIHRWQRERETLAGLRLRQKRRQLRKLHQNAQRLLRPLVVINPYAEQLSFPDSATRTRRDHEKYLALIRSIALLHQYQREIRVERASGESIELIEVTIDDIALANRLADEVLGRTLDELPPQTLRLLALLEEMVEKACADLELDRTDYRFTRRELREHTGWGNTQLKIHLARLADLEYLAIYTSGHAQRHLYELLFDGRGIDGRPALNGLIDVESLRYDTNRSGQNGNRSAPGRPLVGGWSGGGRGGLSPVESITYDKNRPGSLENAHLGSRENAPSNSKNPVAV